MEPISQLPMQQPSNRRLILHRRLWQQQQQQQNHIDSRNYKVIHESKYNDYGLCTFSRSIGYREQLYVPAFCTRHTAFLHAILLSIFHLLFLLYQIANTTYPIRLFRVSITTPQPANY